MLPSLRILVVDDDPDIARGTSRLLEQAGFAVTVAGTGAAALEALAVSLPHIVLLDRHLPDLDGLEICQRIKANPATAGIFVVIASAVRVSEADQLTGLESGADGYITRPLGNRELRARIEAFARLVRLHQKLADEVAQRRLLEAELDERVWQRTNELTIANGKLEEARRAAVNLMQDATAAQRRLASVNQQLASEIAERGQAEEKLNAAYIKLELLWEVASLVDADLKTLADHILVGITRLSASQYGFYGFVNEDESVMTIHSWSGEAMQDCAMVSKPAEFPVCQAGVWAEAIHRRKPLILNDYAATHAGKKGLPAGHVALINLLVVPYFFHGRITAVAAVANRATDYGPDDVQELQSFMASTQAVVERRQAEEALLQSERLFRLEFDDAPIGRCMVGLNGRFSRVNPAFCTLLGYSEADLAALTFPEVTHPDDLAASREGVAQLLAGAASHLDLEKRYLTKSGQTVWGAVHVALVRDAAGAPFHFSVHIQDITARKRAEAALLASETLLNSAQRLSKIGGWEWDLASQTMTWTEETYRLHDLQPESCGPRSAQLIELSAACYAPEDRRTVLAAFRRCAEEGQAYDLECAFTSTAGRVLWVRTTAEAFWDGPRIVRVVGNLMDITERKQAQKALRESEAQQRLLLQKANDAIYVHALTQDAPGQFLEVNDCACRMLGYTRDELLALAIPQIDVPGQAARVPAIVQQLFATGSAVFETEHLTKKGGRIPVEVSAGLFTLHGQPAVLSVARDITERKQAEAALRASLHEKESLLKEIHHRVKNNLQIISSLLRLQSHKIENPIAKSTLMDMQNRVRSMALIHEHLYRSTNLAEVDLAAYLKQLCQQLFRVLVATPGAVQLRLDMVPVRLGIDQAIPCGLLVNELFSNALKHAFPNGRTGEIRVELQLATSGSPEPGKPSESTECPSPALAGTLSPSDGERAGVRGSTLIPGAPSNQSGRAGVMSLRLRVADTGVGLPEGFNLKQLNSLGLQLISDLSRQLGGRLEIGPGPGSSFEVVFKVESPT